MNKIEFIYDTKTYDKFTKFVDSPIINSKLNFKIATLAFNRNSQRYTQDKLYSFNPDLVLFLGGIINDYSKDIKPIELREEYYKSKIIIYFLF